MTETNIKTIKQGDLRLLDTEIAKELLDSTLPARLAYIALDGTPRVVPTWFQWTGEELVMPTFIRAPHVSQEAARLRALRRHPEVAISIDTNAFPPHVLSVRGVASITEVNGLVPEYVLSAQRYIGKEAAEAYLSSIDQPGTRMARIAVRPAWVGVLDFEGRRPGAMSA